MFLEIPLLFWWLIAAIILAAVEVIAPGFFLIWLSAAAAITGLLAGFVLPSAAVQLLFFALLAVAAVVFGRRLVKPPSFSDDPLLNDRVGRLIGTVAIVVDPIVNGQGRVKIADSPWPVTGPDAAAGTKVRIIGASGTTLHIALL